MSNTSPSKGFTADEKAAMKERARELKASANKAEAEAEVLAKIAEMPAPDRAMAQRLHKLILTSSPELASKTWYGMPAYTLDGTVVCFFQAASKFNTRYATLGFSDTAKLDDGDIWPTVFAITSLTAAVEAQIAELVRRATAR